MTTRHSILKLVASVVLAERRSVFTVAAQRPLFFRHAARALPSGLCSTKPAWSYSIPVSGACGHAGGSAY